MIEEIAVKIGILVVGSLYWDDTEHRRNWRREHLCLDARKHVKVKAPIRYGRRSDSRGCSYTMVFSASLGEKQHGRAIVVPCKSQNLVEEAECLWTAERRFDKKPNGRISAPWGCVALMMNPDRPITDDLRQCWTSRVSREPCYGKKIISAYDEEVVLDRYGFLKIPWPKSEDGSALDVDALLATATKPTPNKGCYPSAQDVADAWNTPEGKKHVDYFCKNRAHGIKTFQDGEIEERLRELWQ